MRPEDCVGRTGRTLSEVAATGRVEVAGESFDALTVGPPIPSGEVVEVTGWRLPTGRGTCYRFRCRGPTHRASMRLAARRSGTTEERLAELGG